jgi:hypothetical protein
MKSGKMRLKASVRASSSVTFGPLLAVNPCIPVDVSSTMVQSFGHEKTR